MTTSRYATAHWQGDLKTGKGTLSTPASGLMSDTPYGFNSRFGDLKGTNPEELIAAAHAGCFTMALSAKLTEAGHPPAALDTRAEVCAAADNSCLMQIGGALSRQGLYKVIQGRARNVGLGDRVNVTSPAIGFSFSGSTRAPIARR